MTWIVCALVALVGVLLAVLTHGTAREREEERARLQFRSRVIKSAAAIEKEVRGLSEVLFSLQGLFDSSEEVTDDEFAIFCNGPLERLPAIRAMAWAPIQPPTSEDEEFCCPVTYVRASRESGLKVALDLAAEPRMRRALATAGRLQRPVLTDPLPWLDTNDGDHVTVLTLAVMPPADPSATESVDGRKPLGHVLLVFRPEDLLRNPISGTTALDTSAMDFRIEDADVDGGRLTLYSTPTYDPSAAGFVQPITLDWQHWTLRGHPTAEFLAAAQTNRPLVYGALAAMLWLVITGLAWLGMYRARRRASDEHARTIQSVLRSLNEGVIVSDTQGRIQYANKAAQRIAGVSLSDTQLGAMSESYGCYLPDRTTLYPEDRLPLARALNGEEVADEDMWLQNPNVPEGKWVGVSASPLRSEKGELQGGVCVFRDVTERRQLEAQRVEMHLAAEVQKNLYPHESPPLPGFDLAGAVYSADATCGDYFDFVRLDRSRILIAVGDVSGHGLGPALIMTQVRAYVRALAQTATSPEDILNRLNRILADDLHDQFFVTMFLGILDTRTRRLEWANAGHIPACVLTEDGDVRAELRRTGVPLSIFADTDYTPGEPIDLRPGDTTCFFTDGITESRSVEDDSLYEERALEVVRANQSDPACEIIERIYESVRDFSGGRCHDDDVTMVVLKAVETGKPVRSLFPSRPRSSGLMLSESGSIRIHRRAQ